MDANAQNSFLDEFDGKHKVLSYLEKFQNNMVPDYQAFLKSNRLRNSDVERILKMSLRRQFFKAYFENQQKAAQLNFIIPFKRTINLENWLEKQRKEVVYMDSPNFIQRAQWLAEQLGWSE